MSKAWLGENGGGGGGGRGDGTWLLVAFCSFEKKNWRFKSENHPNLRGFDRDFKVNMHNFRLDG